MSRLKPNVILLAPWANAREVGESLSTFRWVQGLSQQHNVTVLTIRRKSREPLASQLPGVEVIEWVEPSVFESAERINSMLKPAYAIYYYQARRWIHKAIASGRRFDLIHQISPLAPRYPSPAVNLGIPFIIGPVGGCQPTPAGMQRETQSMPWYTQFRALDSWRLRFDPFLQTTFAGADMVISVSPQVRDILAPLVTGNVQIMPETGLPKLPDLQDNPAKQESGSLHLLYVGRIVRTKGVRDAVRAMGLLKHLNGIHLDIVGDGQDRSLCQSEADSLGVHDRITFHGKQPRSKIDGFLARADIFLFPSYRETTGNALIEAMSYGLPCICADYGGPGFLIDNASGIKVAPTSPDAFAQGLADAITKLTQSPALRSRYGQEARAKVQRELLWTTKINQMSAWYSKAILNFAFQSSVSVHVSSLPGDTAEFNR
jgi:glycosyltransferase involved in cell wall biosynthesis